MLLRDAKEQPDAVPVSYDTPNPDATGNIVMRTVRATPTGDVYIGK